MFQQTKKTDPSATITLQNGSFSNQLKSTSLQSMSAKNLVMPSYYPKDTNSSMSPLRNKKSLNETKFRTQIIIVNCHKHSEELLKFIDVTPGSLAPQCDLCIVDPQNSIAKMKLERIVDVQDRVRMVHMSYIQQLKDLESKVEALTKEINVTNALRNPLMDLLDEFERKTIKEVEYVFRRLKDKFTVLNPLAEVKVSLREKVEDLVVKVRTLDTQGNEALNMLKELLRDDTKIKEDVNLVKNNATKKLEEAKSYNPVMDKDFGIVKNAYEEFSENITKVCERFFLNSMR